MVARSIFLTLLAILCATPEAHAQQNVKAIPEDAVRYWVQGNTVFKQAQSQDDYAQAIALYRKALQIAPAYGNAWYNLSKAQEKLERYDDAIASLRQFIQDSLNDPDARGAQTHIYELEATRDLAAKHAEAPEGKVEALRKLFAGYSVKDVYSCSIVERKGDMVTNVYSCTETQAQGSNWSSYSWMGSRNAQGAKIDVILIGQLHDTIRLEVSGRNLCLPASEYKASLMQYENKWRLCHFGGDNTPDTVVTNLTLDGSFHGKKAIYIEACRYDDYAVCLQDATRYREYIVLE